MPKLNLRTAQRIKVAAGEALAIKGAGFEWFRKARVLVSGGVVSNFTRGGVQYSQWLTRVSGSMTVLDNPLYSHQVAVGAGGGSTGNLANRGGGGAGEVRVNPSQLSQMVAGVYDISIGAGGAAGSPGSDSIVMFLGAELLIIKAGGVGGSGAVAGGDGGNGGGAGGNMGSRLGGVGIQFNGGASGGITVSPGGGGGAGGHGLPGGSSSGIGGNGGPGLDIIWTEPALHVGGGGGGGGISQPGTATHGGTNGTESTVPLDADWSGGSGGARLNTVAQARGGDGFFVIVAPSKHVEFIQA